jgi:hypothetical protein
MSLGDGLEPFERAAIAGEYHGAKRVSELVVEGLGAGRTGLEVSGVLRDREKANRPHRSQSVTAIATPST